MLRGAVRNLSRPKPEAPIQEHINWYVQQGYRVDSQSEVHAQLVKPKGFSVVWAIIWLILGIFPLFIYLFYYAAKKDQQVYLTVTDGKVSAR